MEPHQSFIAELVLLAVGLIVIVLRFWVIRHQRRGLEDWVRDICFGTSALLSLSTTGCLAWYCWEATKVYQLATVLVDREMARDSTVGLTGMTATQLSEKREATIEITATVILMGPSYRRFLFFIWGAYFTELYLLKGAFLAFYWRLFFRVQSRLVHLLYGTTIVVIIAYIITFMIHFTWCTPVHRNWTMPLSEFPGNSSIDNLTTLTIGTFLNIATDLMILILPLLIVQSFNLKRREKWGLCFIFSVGVMCVTASAVRYHMLYLPFDHMPATSKGALVALLWSTIELTTGFIAFCLPSFRLMLSRAIKRGRDVIRSKHRSTRDCAPEDPSTGSSGTKSKKKNLPRHPNTLLTADFVTLNTTISREDKGNPTEQGTIVYPPNALTCGGGGDVQINIGVNPEDNYNSPDKLNGIQVTDSAGECDAASTPYRFSSPPWSSFANKSGAEEHVLMPMQHVYDPSGRRTGSQESLRPTSRARQYSAV